MKKQFLLFLIVFFVAAFLLLNNNFVNAWYYCSPERLLAERNPVEKVYCYAEKYNGHFQGPDYDDAYMNDPIFKVLVPIAENIIELEGRGNLSQYEVLLKTSQERRIETIFDQRNKDWEMTTERQKEEESKTIIYIFAGSLFVIWVSITWYEYTRPGNVEERHRRREQNIITRQENERITREKIEREKQERELRLRQAKEAEMVRYQQLRKDIEAMPQYEHWRQAVFEKFGRKCAVCGCTENLEVDHRYKSLYAILRSYKITNTMQAYECAALWDVNNGAPLCKMHHDQTITSTYRQQQNSSQDKI